MDYLFLKVQHSICIPFKIEIYSEIIYIFIFPKSTDIM